MQTIVKSARVEIEGSGGLVVEWSIDGAGAAVDIAAGSTPDAADHVHLLSVGPGTSSVRLDGLGSQRCYVSVRAPGSDYAVVTAVRRVGFEGVQNFRDLGGYRTADGGHTVWGQIFRSDALHKLTPSDLVAFDRIGVRLVYDLRGDDERATHPNPIDSIQLAVVGQPRDGNGTIDSTQFGAASDGERLLRDLYLGMLVHSAALFGQLLTGLVNPENRPAVFHCHAGKDRTGVAAALLLLALGVDREDILDDYELTRRYRTLDHQQDSLARLLAVGMSPEAAAGVLTAPRWTMRDALDAVDTEHGGIDAYLTGPAGMSPSSLRELRAVLVTRPAP
ncbi:MAG: tyrosine-protein phosphatase [Acidimicrobiales bacterium]